jgi:two-component system sensor histidine kinase/response regulator
MRISFRTKLLLCLTVLVLLTLAGTVVPISRALRGSFDRLAEESFLGTRQSIATMRAERVERMRQEGSLIMVIPELRALIAEHSSELTKENVESLRDRLDDLAKLADSQCIAVLDSRGSLVAQNGGSPWASVADLSAYLSGNAQASSLVRGVFRSGGASEVGLWVHRGALYEVVGIPLVFSGDGGQADGALLIATQWTDSVATELARGHACQISFVSDDAMLASSVPSAARDRLVRSLKGRKWPTGVVFEMPLDTTYASWLQPLVDPSSGRPVAQLLIQGSQREATAIRGQTGAILAAIAAIALAFAVATSLWISGRLTHPIRQLSEGVARVATGDLAISLKVARKDELGQLAGSFNDMVIQLRRQRELQQLVAETQAATKAKSQFLANMSHEIRTPLHGVIGMTNLLLKTPLDDRQRRLTSLAKSSAAVLATLINDILDFSKIEAGKLELEAVDFDLHALAEDVVELLSEKAFAKGIDLFVDVDPSAPRCVRGDPTRLRQILINLIGNAVKFTERGSVTLRVTPERFEVIDTGIGIPPDRIERLFKSFSQVDASTTRRFGGTGLGLAISKQLVELMSGAIGVESEVGKGSNFWFILPLASASAEVGAPVDPLPDVSALVVDPSEPSRRHLLAKLRSLGARATDDPASGPFDVVIGPRESFDARTPVAKARVLLTTAANVPSPADARAAGFAATALKPIRLSQLTEAIRQALNPSESPKETTAPTTRKPFNGYRLLIAEDTEANQIVAVELLSEEGYDCHIAPNGRHATQAHASGKFDLILMDCQMPEMDGFEATAAIRAAEPEGTRIPIIALTANASGADGGRCIAAGMDGYCSKPFDPPELFRVLSSFLPPKASEGASNATSPDPLATPASPVGLSALDLAGDQAIDLPAMLRRCNNKPALAAAVLRKFQTQAEEATVNLDRYLADDDVEGVARVAHALKGTAGVISADALRADAARLEALARDGGSESLPDAVAALRASLVATLAAAADLVPQLVVTPARSAG